MDVFQSPVKCIHCVVSISVMVMMLVRKRLSCDYGDTMSCLLTCPLHTLSGPFLQDELFYSPSKILSSFVIKKHRICALCRILSVILYIQGPL